MKVKLLDETGALQGWVVSLCFTTITIILLILGFFVPIVQKGWVAIGGTYSTIYIGSLGVWFGYKSLKSFSGGGVTTTS
jgi:hypothetical protein